MSNLDLAILYLLAFVVPIIVVYIIAWLYDFRQKREKRKEILDLTLKKYDDTLKQSYGLTQL